MQNPFLKWTMIVSGVLVAFAGLTAAYVYVASSAVVGRTYDLSVTPLTLSKPVDAARGAHLARVLGCINCHGEGLQGGEMQGEAARFVKVYATNLTRLAERYADDDFTRAIRQGVKSDGTTVRFMPSASFSRVSDDDIAALIAYIRSQPVGGKEHPKPVAKWIGRAFLAFGLGVPEALRAIDQKDTHPLDLGEQTAPGRYLASIACAGCHGLDLKGRDRFLFVSPDLLVVGGYEREDFRNFMRTGTAVGGRTLPFMSNEAVKEFTHFTDAEIDALYDYLRARVEATPAK